MSRILRTLARLGRQTAAIDLEDKFSARSTAAIESNSSRRVSGGISNASSRVRSDAARLPRTRWLAILTILLFHLPGNTHAAETWPVLEAIGADRCGEGEAGVRLHIVGLVANLERTVVSQPVAYTPRTPTGKAAPRKDPKNEVRPISFVAWTNVTVEICGGPLDLRLNSLRWTADDETEHGHVKGGGELSGDVVNMSWTIRQGKDAEAGWLRASFSTLVEAEVTSRYTGETRQMDMALCAEMAWRSNPNDSTRQDGRLSSLALDWLSLKDCKMKTGETQ